MAIMWRLYGNSVAILGRGSHLRATCLRAMCDESRWIALPDARSVQQHGADALQGSERLRSVRGMRRPEMGPLGPTFMIKNTLHRPFYAK